MGQRRQRAFTLVELVMVLLILGVLGGVAAPRLFSKRAFDADFYAADVLSALRYAQRLAVASGCPVEVRFSGDDYALHQRGACQTGAFVRDVPHPGSGAPAYTGRAPAGTSLLSSVNPLVFDPLGRALDGALAPTDASVSVGGRVLQVAGETGLAWDPAS